MKPHVPHPSLSVCSRRDLLKGAAALAFGRLARPAFAQQAGSVLAYIGTYTPNGLGIHILSVNPADGSLTMVKAVTGTTNPSSIAFDASKKFLFAVNEISNYNGSKSDGSVTAFTVNRATGDLTPVNVVSSHGAGPAHISVAGSGNYVLVSNYGGGTISVIPFDPNTGALGAATDVETLSGPLGPLHPVEAPFGSFAISGHDAHHAHMAATDPSGKWVIGTDLGGDRIYVWQFNTTSGTLTPANPPSIAASLGAGPRHFAFHPNGRWCYIINEEASSLAFMQFDPVSGSLQPQQILSTLPMGFLGTNYTSEVAVSADGNFVYGANRLHDTIAVFSINSTGGLALLGETSTGGDYPRSFGIEPSGSYMYVLNQRSDNIGILKIDRTTGLLTQTGLYNGVGSPSSIAFLS
ncbi:MAG TPA: lactonase family protein [Bryobacteraceae bacterium]|nr:lactonase family protein [Bryobacteraceae bacterium]